MTFWVFFYFWVLLLLSRFEPFGGARPLYWEVNKLERLQWQSENKRHFCETGKVSTVFPRFFFAFKRKNRESEGRTSKSWLLSFNVGQFWRIFGQIAILELWVEKLAKILENVEKDREFDVFTKNSRQFGDFFRISNLDRQNWPKIRQFDVVFRVNSSVSFNHEEFSISFQFDEFFSTFELSPVKTDQKFANLTLFFG